jgi:hypothetical protein
VDSATVDAAVAPSSLFIMVVREKRLGHLLFVAGRRIRSRGV